MTYEISLLIFSLLLAVSVVGFIAAFVYRNLIFIIITLYSVVVIVSATIDIYSKNKIERFENSANTTLICSYTLIKKWQIVKQKDKYLILDLKSGKLYSPLQCNKYEAK